MQQLAVAAGGTSTLGNELQLILFGHQHCDVFLLVTPQSFVVSRKANPEGLDANASVPSVAVDMWQSSTSFTGRD